MLKIVKKPEPVKEEPKAAAPAKSLTKASTTKAAAEAPAEVTGTLMQSAPMSKVTCSVTYSHKLENEDWIKIQVGLETDVPADEYEAAYEVAKAWVDSKIDERVTELNTPSE